MTYMENGFMSNLHGIARYYINQYCTIIHDQRLFALYDQISGDKAFFHSTDGNGPDRHTSYCSLFAVKAERPRFSSLQNLSSNR